MSSSSGDEAAAGDGFTRVYDEKGAKTWPEGERFFAVRRGKSVGHCIFLYWEDCAAEIENNDDAEYEVFGDLYEACSYVTKPGKEKKLPKRPKGGAGKRGKKARGKVDSRSEQEKAVSPPRKKSVWDKRYEELVAFNQINGHVLVPVGKAKDKLGSWVSRQRLEYRYMKEGKPSPMNASRVAKLEQLGFVFNAWAAKRERAVKEEDEIVSDEKGGSVELWQKRFEQLKEYKEKFNTCDVPLSDKELGSWVSRQRKNHKLAQEGKPSGMTAGRLLKLQEIGFKWEGKRGPKGPKAVWQKGKEPVEAPSEVARADISEPQWDEMYEELREHKRLNGTCQVPHRPYTPLRGWIAQQQREYKKLREKKPSILTAEKIQKLNDLGYVFRTKEKATWASRIQALKDFKQEHGHVVVPRHHTGLGKWVAQQRHKYKLLNEGKPSTMTYEKVQELNSLGMVWSIIKMPENRAERKPWEERFNELLAFKAQHGHTVVPQHYPELGNWVHQQRTHYKLMKQNRKTLMTQEKALKLAEIDFKFEVKPRKKDRPDEGESLERAAQRAAKAKESFEEYSQQDGDEVNEGAGGEESNGPEPIDMAVGQHPGEVETTSQQQPLRADQQQLVQPPVRQHANYGQDLFDV